MDTAQQKERAVTAVAGDLIGLADKFGFVESIKSKLMRQPDLALARLAAALGEIRKIYIAFEKELNDFSSLTLEQDELPEERASLQDLANRKFSLRMNEARGHCHKITNIYERYLNPWLRRIPLIGSEDVQMRQLFQDMAEADSLMLDVILNLGNWLGPTAIEIQKLVDANDLPTARQRLLQAQVEVAPDRQAINDSLQKLFKLQADFIKASGAI
jgi:hypothetical protein